jgi:hypothetical protein
MTFGVDRDGSPQSRFPWFTREPIVRQEAGARTEEVCLRHGISTTTL